MSHIDLANDEQARSITSISVVICAYTQDRWEDTLRAVSSVQQQSLQPAETILVVDHNHALYHRLKTALPDIIVAENREEPGLSGGKNTGIALAQGGIVAFLDDDAVAHPDWLKFLNESYADQAVVGVGGRTLPSWDTQRPRWFPEEFDWVVGCTYTGTPKCRARVRNLFGGNASFRREVFDAVGGFSHGIGRSAGGKPQGCEETEFCIRLNQQFPDWILLYDNRAVIRHRVPIARCRSSYFHSRCYAEGRSKALVAASVGTTDGLSSERSYTMKTLPAGVLRGIGQALSGDPAHLSRSVAIISGLTAALAGFTAGTLQQWFAAHPRLFSSPLSPDTTPERT